MPLTLYVDTDRWQTHLRGVIEAEPLTVPVIKGNGYGLGRERLARQSGDLGLGVVAAGTYAEVPALLDAFDGDVVVLSPWRSFDVGLADLSDPARAARVIHTVGRLEDLGALQALQAQQARQQPDVEPRVLLERRTSMLRHGLDARGLRQAGRVAREGGVRIEGVSAHFGLAGAHLAEARRVMLDVVAAGLDGVDVWVSHLTATEVAQLRAEHPGTTVRTRSGTGLWLGERDALTVRATVLDIHPVERGQAYGYRGRTAPRAGVVMVVSGGTAHGLGLEAPTGASGLRSRAVALAKGGMDAAGWVRSPFTVDGEQRYFAEPPHMQASMLFVPHGPHLPDVGEEVDVRVRFTTASFDRVLTT
ncbi:alanine racemase [Nocardioidaceae bacterium]|nr:alanine racemase [Nocardioidaceae bacterium]